MESDKKTFAVTGAAGFICSHLVEKLLSQGHIVYGLDNFENGVKENMSSFINNENFKFFEKDFSDTEQMNDLIALLGFQKVSFDGIFHVGGLPRITPSIANPARTFACNVIGTFAMLEFARALKINRFVYSASSSAYGQTDKLPNSTSDDENCNNPYSVTKWIGEELCTTWAKCYGINTVSLRYFNVYGPRSQLAGSAYDPLIGIFYRQKLKEKVPMTIVEPGTQRRDMTYVSDVVSANLAAMEKCHLFPGRVFNVGTGKNYSVLDVARMVSGETAFIPPRLHDAKATLADIRDTTECLGWTPKVSFEEGIELMRQHYTELFKDE